MNEVNKTLLICSFLLFQVGLVFSQISNSLPSYFHDFHTDPSIDNPAIFNTENDIEVNFHYKSFYGPLSEIKIFNGSGYLIKDEKQRFGFRMQSEREGKYFQRNRSNLVYAINISLAEKIELSASSYLGGLFYSFKSYGNFQGGQDQDLDYGLGIALRINTFRLGFSSNQINEPVLRPLSYTFGIQRYYEIYLENKFNLPNDWCLTVIGKHRKTPNPLDKITHLHAVFFPKNEAFSFGTHYLHNLGFSPTFGVKVPYDKSKDQMLIINMSFFLAVNKNNTRDNFIKNQYEVSIKWVLQK